MERYSENANYYKDFNLADAGISVTVDIEKVPDDIKDVLIRNGQYDESISGRYPWFDSWTVEGYDIPYEAVDWGDSIYDEKDAEYYLRMLIKDAPKYLVFASGCRWNGASGYKICENVADTVRRKYEVAIHSVAASKGGKVLKCIESSHDVPTGAVTYIVALNKQESEAIENMDFDMVRAFVTKKAKALK